MRAVVLVHELGRVDVERPPGVDRDEDGPRVRVNLLALVPHTQVVQDIGLVEKLQCDQVVRALEVCGVARHHGRLRQVKRSPLLAAREDDLNCLHCPVHHLGRLPLVLPLRHPHTRSRRSLRSGMAPRTHRELSYVLLAS